jgi:acid phosphatase class B
MCTVLLPPGDNPIAVNKYIYHIINFTKSCDYSIRKKFDFLKAVLLKFQDFWEVMVCWLIVIGVLKDYSVFQI